MNKVNLIIKSCKDKFKLQSYCQLLYKEMIFIVISYDSLVKVEGEDIFLNEMRVNTYTLAR